MVYNFNLGIGWASSGVEYAQSYRANLLRRAHIPARFVFTDMFPTENIEHMTRNIGFLDEEVIWLYTFFTDVRTSPVTFTLKELEATMAEEDYTFSREGKTCRYQFKESGRFYRKIRFQMSWRESLCITMSSVTERISSRSMSISK